MNDSNFPFPPRSSPQNAREAQTLYDRIRKTALMYLWYLINTIYQICILKYCDPF